MRPLDAVIHVLVRRNRDASVWQERAERERRQAQFWRDRCASLRRETDREYERAQQLEEQVHALQKMQPGYGEGGVVKRRWRL